MNNGYYLSAYIDINELASAYMVSERHDHSVSLWKKEGEQLTLVRYWELERISGYKQHQIPFVDKDQAVVFLNGLLEEFELCVDDMEEIWGIDEFSKNMEYTSLTRYPEYSYHTISHIFSGLLMDSNLFYNENILVFAVDAAPDTVVDKNGFDKYLYSGAYSVHGKIEVFPVISPALLWFEAAACFKLREGSLMALASASTAAAVERCQSIDGLTYENQGSWVQNTMQKIMGFINSLSDGDKRVRDWDDRFCFADNKISIAMKEIQQLSLEIMEFNLNKIIERYNINPQQTILSVTGGFALNCPCNSYLMHRFGFKNYMSPPCVSDTGISLGIAMLAFYNRMSRLDFKMDQAFYGMHDLTSDEELIQSDFGKYINRIDGFNPELVAEDIIKEPIVWFNGNAEIGPRALGNRSIIGDPRSNSMKDKMNRYKKRQWWRPVAPIVLKEYMDDYFENVYESPFMLHTFYVREEKRKRIPAVLHLDYSARVQTLGREQNPMLYQVIDCFKKRTGIPIVCNTSLNDAGEPIINTIYQALNFALRKGIKIVYFNGRRIELVNHADYHEEAALQRGQNFFEGNRKNGKIIRQYNPYHIPDEVVRLMIEYPEPFKKYDITVETDARRVEKIGKYIINKRYYTT